jgi:hypothetical protein
MRIDLRLKGTKLGLREQAQPFCFPNTIGVMRQPGRGVSESLEVLAEIAAAARTFTEEDVLRRTVPQANRNNNLDAMPL